mmetsp:Transcript_12690/g.21172  ORF Transcript_12690/g.21172 Transcript_12690/m.21172 type:complete len:233 (-) Transcript_12690:211-909(-)
MANSFGTVFGHNIYYFSLLFHPTAASNTNRSWWLVYNVHHVGYIIRRHLRKVASNIKEINDGIEGTFRLRRRCAPTAPIATANDNVFVDNESCVAIDVRYLFQIQQKSIIGPGPVLSKVELRRQDVVFALSPFLSGKPHFEMNVRRTVGERCWFVRDEFKAAIFFYGGSAIVLEGRIDIVGICRVGMIVEPGNRMGLPNLNKTSWYRIVLLIEDLARNDQGNALCSNRGCAN